MKESKWIRTVKTILRIRTIKGRDLSVIKICYKAVVMQIVALIYGQTIRPRSRFK